MSCSLQERADKQGKTSSLWDGADSGGGGVGFGSGGMAVPQLGTYGCGGLTVCIVLGHFI